jgi:hypothetical protein
MHLHKKESALHTKKKTERKRLQAPQELKLVKINILEKMSSSWD